MAIRAIRRGGATTGPVWRYEVTGYTPAGAQFRRRFTTKREAQAFEASQRVARLARDGELTAADLTVGELVGLWFADYERRVRATSARAQWFRWLMVEPLLGAVRLDRVRSGHLDDALRTIMDRDERPATGQTPERVRGVLSTVFRWAVDRGILERNPVRTMRPLVDRPSGRTPGAWSLDEVRRVMTWSSAALADVEGTRFYDVGHSYAPRVRIVLPMVLLMVWTGLRVGEARALTWADIDEGAGPPVLRVRSTFSGSSRSDEVIGPPKTRASRRGIVLLDPAAEVIALQRARQADRRRVREALAIRDEDGGWVFDNGQGHSVAPDLVASCLRWVARETGVATLTPHGLRHTFATISLEAGVPARVVQEMLGHASLAFTVDLYSHVSIDLQRVASEVLVGAYRQAPAIAVPSSRDDGDVQPIGTP